MQKIERISSIVKLLAIDFQTSDSLKTSISSYVFVALSERKCTTCWGTERETRRRYDKELDWDKSLLGEGLGGNRPKMIRLWVIQSSIEIDTLSMCDIESSDVVLTGGTFISCDTNDIAFFYQYPSYSFPMIWK